MRIRSTVVHWLKEYEIKFAVNRIKVHTAGCESPFLVLIFGSRKVD